MKFKKLLLSGSIIFALSGYAMAEESTNVIQEGQSEISNNSENDLYIGTNELEENKSEENMVDTTLEDDVKDGYAEPDLDLVEKLEKTYEINKKSFMIDNVNLNYYPDQKEVDFYITYNSLQFLRIMKKESNVESIADTMYFHTKEKFCEIKEIKELIESNEYTIKINNGSIDGELFMFSNEVTDCDLEKKPDYYTSYYQYYHYTPEEIKRIKQIKEETKKNETKDLSKIPGESELKKMCSLTLVKESIESNRFNVELEYMDNNDNFYFSTPIDSCPESQEVVKESPVEEEVTENSSVLDGSVDIIEDQKAEAELSGEVLE